MFTFTKVHVIKGLFCHLFTAKNVVREHPHGLHSGTSWGARCYRNKEHSRYCSKVDPWEVSCVHGVKGWCPRCHRSLQKARPLKVLCRTKLQLKKKPILSGFMQVSSIKSIIHILYFFAFIVIMFFLYVESLEFCKM